MKLLNVDTLKEARDKLFAATAGKPMETEYIQFTESLGRVLAEDLLAVENVPDFCKSTVDGYAVIAADTQGVTENIPVFLDVMEEVEMGKVPLCKLESGQAVYVPTGGMLPEGADAMVMVEYCEKFDERSIAVYDAVSPGRNVIAAGEDLCKGQVLVEKGRSLRPQEIGVLSAAGVSRAKVFKPWDIAIISTGDELVDVGQTLEKGQTRDINTYSISTMAQKHGFRVVETKVLRDDEALLEDAVRSAMEKSDMVVVSGGSSQGEKDRTADVLDRLSSPGVFTHGIALKPGKPTILAYDERSETVLLGLPGHPAAAMMVFQLLGVWLYRKLMGQPEPKATVAVLAENVAAAGGKTTCLLVSLEEMAEGGYCAVPVFGKSGLMTTLTRADGYTLIDANAEGLREGQQVRVTLF